MQMTEYDPVKVSFHFIDGSHEEKMFDNEEIAREYIRDLMFGKILYEAEHEGKAVIVPLHVITGAVIHAQPVAND